MSDESFINRWSRLKHRRKESKAAPPETREEKKTELAARSPPSDPPPAAEPEDGDPKVIAALPTIESLGKDSDYSPFMRQGVPQALRMQALRKMWATDPTVAVPDPFEMHNVDFTHLVADAGEVVKSSYQAGRGFVDALEKVAVDKTAEPAQEVSPGKDGSPAKDVSNETTPAPDKAAKPGTPKPRTA